MDITWIITITEVAGTGEKVCVDIDELSKVPKKRVIFLMSEAMSSTVRLSMKKVEFYRLFSSML